jgi:HD-GYP domain-containing protein (c-di-GMP phosphodiesterase class II)
VIPLASRRSASGSAGASRRAGDEIPLLARIVACCDAFNAMTSDRSYRKALPQHEAVAELRRGRGTQFDPRVVDALIETLAVA